MSRRISISCFWSPAPVNIGRSLAVPFKVMNDTSERLPAQRLQLIGDHYWEPTCSVAVPALSPYTESRPVTLRMRCRWTTDPAAVPASFSVRLDGSGAKTTFTWSFWVFTKTLADYNPVGLPGANGADKYMLLCFGLAGSGKSSFFNSALTLMHSGKRQRSSGRHSVNDGCHLRSTPGVDKSHCSVDYQTYVIRS